MKLKYLFCFYIFFSMFWITLGSRLHYSVRPLQYFFLWKTRRKVWMSDWMGCTQLQRFDETDGLLHLHTIPSVNICIKQKCSTKDYWEGRKEGHVLFNDTLNTFYLRIYGVRHMVKDHSDNKRGNPLPPHRLLFSINSKVFLYAPSHS